MKARRPLCTHCRRPCTATCKLCQRRLCRYHYIEHVPWEGPRQCESVTSFLTGIEEVSNVEKP